MIPMRKTASFLFTVLLSLTSMLTLTASAIPGAAVAEAQVQTRPHSVTANVYATQDWQDTGVYVRADRPFKISYKYGAWTVDHRNFPYVGPEGYSADQDRKIYQGCKFSSEYPYGYLIGAVGHSHDPVTLYVGKGGSRSFRVRISGPLFLRINDDTRCLGDNAGVVVMKITTY
jgi:hypothetical protein